MPTCPAPPGAKEFERSAPRGARVVRLAAVAGAFAVLTGCGGTLYAINASSAAARLEEAKELGADRYAPYEYYYAKAHLEQAQIDSEEASYSDAIHYAEAAEEYADKAVNLTKSRRASGK